MTELLTTAEQANVVERDGRASKPPGAVRPDDGAVQHGLDWHGLAARRSTR
jgi:hypothetical protein